MRFFNLLTENPWPYVCSGGVLVLMFGAIQMFAVKSMIFFFSGLVIVGLTIYVWFVDIISENFKGSHKKFVENSFQFGMILFILSEIFFFFGFFWAFFYKSVNPLIWESKSFWPPFVPLDAWSVPFLKTLLLVSSGVSLTWVHHILMEKSSKQQYWFMHLGFFVTVVFGLLFELFQGMEYSENFFSMKSTMYGSSFYMLTGFHGFHVMMGLLILMVCWARLSSKHFKEGCHKHFLLGAWYWHFVDVVWLFLFMFMYLGFN